MGKTLDLIGIGECLVEFTALTEGAYQLDYAGDVLNALTAASTLGMKTGLISAMGDDPFLPRLFDILNTASIDHAFAPILRDRSNGVYFVMPKPTGKSVFHFIRKHSAARETFAVQSLKEIVHYARSSTALLLSTIPLAVMKNRKRLIKLLEVIADDVLIYFDLNVRASLWPDMDELRVLVSDLGPLVHTLFITDDDDVALFGKSENVRTAIQRYTDMGYEMFVYRRGSNDTVAGVGDILYEVPTAASARVIDTTGAGDNFNAGFIAAVFRHCTLVEAVKWGNAAAASVLGHCGGRGIVTEDVTAFYNEISMRGVRRV